MKSSNHSSRSRRGAGVVASLLIAMTASAAVIGCGPSRPERVKVSGQVRIDGKPLGGGVIRLYPANARPASARIGADGRFTLKTFEDGDGAVLGTHPVTVTWIEHISDTQRRWRTPKKYDDPNSSGLTATIDGPTDSLTLELTWAGGKPFLEVDQE